MAAIIISCLRPSDSMGHFCFDRRKREAMDIERQKHAARDPIE